MKQLGSSSKTSELTAIDLRRQFNISDKDLQLIRSFADLGLVDENLLVADFYVWLQAEAWFKTFFPSGIVKSVRDLQSKYWTEFLSAAVDDDYVSRRISLGNVHAKINLPVRAYIAGMSFVQSSLEKILIGSSLKKLVREKTGAAISRLIQLDISIVMHAYYSRSLKQIKDTEVLQKAVMNASLDPMLTIDELGAVQFVSTSIENMFGWRPDEIVGKNIKMLMPNPYHSEHDGYLLNYKNTRQSKIMGAARTLRAVRKNGEEFDCEISVAKVDTGDSNDPLFTGVIRDVTERTTFENRVLEINRVLQSVATGNLSQQITVEGENDTLGQAVFSVVESFQDVAAQANNIGMGNFNVELNLRGDNDELRQALISMRDMLRDVATQANTISQGNFDVVIESRGEFDELGKSLSAMTKNLRKTSNQNRRENWFKTGQTDLADIMRGELDLPALCKKIITFLCKHLGAQVGVFYLLGENGLLRMSASYAYTQRKGLGNEIELGEGLVGQAALEKETIVISDVPDDYMAINSGLGRAVPRNMMVMPILQANDLIGILELGSFQTFSDEQIALVELVNESIAIAIKSSADNGKMTDLLSEARRTTEELQSQQENLKSSNEELQEQTEALKASEEELKTQSEELKQSNEDLEEKSAFLERQKFEIEKQNRKIETSRGELMVKADELELSSKYKSEFLANMSHELRTPLNSLLILSKSLADNREGNLTEDQIESARTVYSGGQELLELINDILDLSKVEAGKLSVYLEDIDIKEMKLDLNSKFKPMSEDKGLALKFEVNSAAPETIHTDNQRMQQILKNLLSNAIKFTSEGSVTVSFHCPASDIRFSRHDLTHEATIGISVTDTGIGIAKEQQQSIFEAFQQVDGTTSRQFGGTGLGLTISRELARLLGGEIQLRSEVDVGSTFTLYLPINGVPVQDEKLVPLEDNLLSSVSRHKQQKIATNTSKVARAADFETIFLPDDRKRITSADKSLLIIEDDRGFAQNLLKLAQARGFKCLSAGNGSSGLHLAQKFQPSAIMLDLTLPDIDGLTILDHLKHDLNTRHIPVHVMSARDARKSSLAAGALAFINKPVTEESLDQSLLKIEKILFSDLKKLLIVEDNLVNRKAVVKLIEDKRIEITDVSDGQSALKLLKSETFDCIILDLDLPDMSGFELLHQLKKDENISLPPVIIHTGRDLDEKECRDLQHYADSIVIKGASSPERLLDDASLFLHSVVSNLPAHQQEMIRMMHEPNQVLHDKKILLVDDDIRNTFAMSKELREHGMEVILADNGQLALELLDTNPDIDLVLMDIMMPVMDGHEAMKKIRQQVKHKNLPIIALTALAMPEDYAQCFESGANDYMSKPVDVGKLLAMMRIWLFGGSSLERRGEGRPWTDPENEASSDMVTSNINPLSKK